MKIPTTVVTGFLGAGKTSLLRHLVRNAEGRRLALVINEFGELGIDRELLLGCGDAACREEDVVELANGCICCTVADDFLPTIARLLDRPDPPEHILIETSGLALPKPLVQAFNWPEVKSRVTVDGVVAVIDAAAFASGAFEKPPLLPPAAGGGREGGSGVLARSFPHPNPPPQAGEGVVVHENPLEEVFSDQLLCADLVVLNKRDLVADAAALKAQIEARIRPAAKVLTATGGEVAPALLLGLGAGAEDDLAARPSQHDGEEHDHDDFESFVVERGPVRDAGAFARQVETTIAAHDVLRVKGFVEIPGRPLRHVVQAVGARVQSYFDRAWKAGESRESRLVVIGRTGLDRSAIAAALQA